MSAAEIIAHGNDDPCPSAQVLDLAVSVAIGRDLARSEAEMTALIGDGFLRPASSSELAASLGRLLDRGAIARMDEGSFDVCLTDAGVEATTRLSGGMIRMIDRGRGYLKTAFLLQMLDVEKGICR